MLRSRENPCLGCRIASDAISVPVARHFRIFVRTGYSHANRAAALARGITPVIPRHDNSKERGRFFPKRLYKLRARIEQTIGKLKRFKRVAMRCEKTDISYSPIVSFACALMLIKSVHTP